MALTIYMDVHIPAAITDGLRRHGLDVLTSQDDQTTTADDDGRFRLQGVAPGEYRLYAWSTLDGAAYRNAEFMRKYDDRGVRVHVEGSGILTADVAILD